MDTRLNLVCHDLNAADLNALHATTRTTTLVVHAKPGIRRDRIRRLAAVLLEAVGVSADVSGAGRDARDDWQLAHVHVAARHPADLIVLDAHHLEPSALQRLAELAYATDATMWLLHPADTSQSPPEVLAGSWHVQRAATSTFRRRFLPRHANRRHPEPASVGDTHVRVPDDEFCTFRATCRDLLPPAQFAAVDRRLRHTAARTRTALTGTVDETSLVELLDELFTDCETVDQMLTTVRGVQTALFHAGWYLQVDIDAFLGMHRTVHTPAARSPQTWQRLRAYRQPHRQATCALAAAGLSLDQMRALTVADVHPDHVTVDGRRTPIEPAARDLLALQTHARRAVGAADDEAYLTDLAGAALSDYQLARAIGDAQTETGVPLINGQVVRRTRDPKHWARRQGLSIQELTA